MLNFEKIEIFTTYYTVTIQYAVKLFKTLSLTTYTKVNEISELYPFPYNYQILSFIKVTNAIFCFLTIYVYFYYSILYLLCVCYRFRFFF